MRPLARSANRCRQRRVTAKYSPSEFPTAHLPAPVTVPGGSSATAPTRSSVVTRASPRSWVRSPGAETPAPIAADRRPLRSRSAAALDQRDDVALRVLEPGPPVALQVRDPVHRLQHGHVVLLER